MGIFFRLLPLLCASALLAACGGGEKAPLTTTTPPATTPGASTASTPATPAAGATPAASSSTSAPAVAGTPVATRRVPVRWVDAPTPLDIAGATESATPYAEQQRMAAQANPRAGPDDWRIMTAGSDGVARPLYSARRMLSGLRWDKDGLHAEILTRRSVYSQPLGKPLDLAWRGSLLVDPSTGKATETFDPFPRATRIAIDPTRYLSLDAAADTLLVSLGRSPLPGAATPPRPSLDSAFLLDTAGKARHLEDLPGLDALKLLPSGKALVGEQLTPGDVYLIPAVSGDAQVVSNVQSLAVEAVQTVAGPAGTSVFLMVQPQSGACCDYVLYDSTAGSVLKIGSGPLNSTERYLSWSGGDEVIAGADLINVRTGQHDRIFPSPAGSAYPPPNLDLTSPDGRTVLHLSNRPSAAPGTASPGCDGLPFKLALEAVGSANSRTVYECPTARFPATAEWLDDGHVLVTSRPCTGPCDDPQTSLSLLDVTGGKLTPLTQGFEMRAFRRPSPDKQRLLIGGNKLRLYSSAGARLREDEAPDGFVFLDGAWSPDSQTYAYHLGPRDWPQQGP